MINKTGDVPLDFGNPYGPYPSDSIDSATLGIMARQCPGDICLERHFVWCLVGNALFGFVVVPWEDRAG